MTQDKGQASAEIDIGLLQTAIEEEIRSFADELDFGTLGQFEAKSAARRIIFRVLEVYH